MGRYLFTVDSPPAGFKIARLFRMVQYIRRFDLSRAALPVEDYENALDVLATEPSLPKDANAIIGIKVSSSILADSKGAYLYLVYIGTPAKITDISKEDNSDG
jgi:hypothetical protein